MSLDEPLTAPEAKRLILEILGSDDGVVSFSSHAEDEMDQDGLTKVDAENIMRGGVCEEAELVNGTWRHRVRTPRIVFVVAFRSEKHIRVVTAFRNKKR